MLEPEVTTPSIVVDCKYPFGKKAFAEFNFRYRSRRKYLVSCRKPSSDLPTESLQYLLLLPRTPSPVPLEDLDPAQLTREELEELVRRQKVRSILSLLLTTNRLTLSAQRTQEQKGQDVAIKKEMKREHTEIGNENADDDEVVVVAKRAKVIETIDLSDD